jgi:exonuclease III
VVLQAEAEAIMEALNNLSIVTYNMHGYNQGCELINTWCNQPKPLLFDCIFLQEHWLNTESLYKLNTLSTEYTSFGVSGMASELNSNILKGRPYGGVAILVNNRLIRMCEVLTVSERLVGIKIGELVLVNVYFPTTSKKDYKDIALELLSQLELLLDQYDLDTCKVIIGGDFNCNLGVASWSSDTINGLMSKFNLLLSNDIVPTDMDYTYEHESLGQFAYLDYFILSRSISNDVVDLCIRLDEPNLSDHLPVSMCLNFGGSAKIDSTDSAPTINMSDQVHARPHYSYRWDRTNLSEYYELTRQGLYPILEYCLTLEGLGRLQDMSQITQIINNVYNAIISVLTEAADKSVPK